MRRAARVVFVGAVASAGLIIFAATARDVRGDERGIQQIEIAQEQHAGGRGAGGRFAMTAAATATIPFVARRIASTSAFTQFVIAPGAGGNDDGAGDDDAAPVGAAAAFGLLAESASFRSTLMGVLRAWPTPALYWECAPVDGSPAAAAAPWTFVLKDAPPLHAVAADPSPFGAKVAPDTAACAAGGGGAGAGAGAATFPNLGGDAMLVAPCDLGGAATKAGAHLGVFSREAPPEQQHELWRQVGVAAGARLRAAQGGGRGPFWVSTSGLGVYWVHVRVDERPKYYQHRPFKVMQQ